MTAVAQLNSAALRAKFGIPLNRETFHMPAGFDLVVDYAANSQACKLQVPALMPSTEQVANAMVMKQRMYDLLSQLVPDSIRGKELRRAMMTMGAISMMVIEYYNVIINELEAGDPFSHDNNITITFRGVHSHEILSQFRPCRNSFPFGPFSDPRFSTIQLQGGPGHPIHLPAGDDLQHGRQRRA